LGIDQITVRGLGQAERMRVNESCQPDAAWVPLLAEHGVQRHIIGGVGGSGATRRVIETEEPYNLVAFPPAQRASKLSTSTADGPRDLVIDAPSHANALRTGIP